MVNKINIHRARHTCQAVLRIRSTLPVFAEQTGKGLYWVIRTQGTSFISCLLTTCGMQVLQYLREFDVPAMQSCKPLPCGTGSGIALFRDPSTCHLDR